MPRCLLATVLSLLLSRTDADLENSWSSKVASKWHLQVNGNGMDRPIDFGMPSRAILPPTWARVGSIWASLGPHWAPSWPHLGLIGLHRLRISTPLGPCQLHERLTRAHLSCICAPAAHLNFIWAPFPIHVGLLWITFAFHLTQTGRHAAILTDRPRIPDQAWRNARSV